MFTTIPKSLMENLPPNVTVEELNDILAGVHFPVTVFIVVIIVIGVIGNILILYIYISKYEPSTYRSFILWLGWIDLSACCVGMPFIIVLMSYPYMFPSEVACKSVLFLHAFLAMSSAFIVTTIAIERYRRTCRVTSAEMNPVKIYKMCFGASVIGCLNTIPRIFIYGDAVVETGVHNLTGIACYVDSDYRNTYFSKGYFMLQISLLVTCPVLIGILYYRIWIRICRHHKFIQDNTYIPGSCDIPVGKTPKIISKDYAITNERGNIACLRYSNSPDVQTHNKTGL